MPAMLPFEQHTNTTWTILATITEAHQHVTSITTVKRLDPLMASRKDLIFILAPDSSLK
jgi:hypothetical protein